MRSRFVTCRLLPVFVLAAGIFLSSGQFGTADDKKPEHSAIKPLQRQDKGAVTRHERFLERAKQGGVNVLFLGDSITQGWEGSGKAVWKERYDSLKAANFGIGGDRTQHILWRLGDGQELQGIQPKVTVLMIGTNNMGSNTAEEIADGVTAIVRELGKQIPSGKVLLLGIFPRSAKPTDKVRDKIKEVNQRIAKLDDGKQVRYLDFGEKFLDKEGNLPKETMPDYLHLSEKGYKTWADAIQPMLHEMLKK